MANNDQIILDQIVSEQRNARALGLKDSDFFEIYVAEQVLKNYDLSDDEIESGLIGDSQDGGIDGIYTFANGELVQDDFDHSGLKKSVLIEVVIIQSKISNGFDEDTINRLIAVTSHLFSLAQPVDNFKNRYNEGVRAAVEMFRKLYTATASRFPELHFRYVYATRGDSRTVHPNVRGKVADLQKILLDLFNTAHFDFSFLGASDLLALARRQPVTSFQMQFTESLTGDKGYVALVKLKEFIRFIRSDSGTLRKDLFEANVRDYQGSTQVNEEMQQTLAAGGPEDFWWLNNGVTVVVSKAGQAGKVLTMEDPQIVNGQQTSTEIFKYFQTKNTTDDERSVMVRVIVANDTSGRDRIIKATNSQTAIPPASLRATEKIHRDIEEFLAPYAIYYDRRKNSQKQQGRTADSIISIGLLAQALMATVLQRPDDARARPSSLIKRGDDYDKIFNDKLPIGIYLFASRIVKAVHTHLRTMDSLSPKDRNNLLFYVAMHLSSALTGKAMPTAADLENVATAELTEEVLKSSVGVVEPIYQTLGSNDQVAKGPELLKALKAKLIEQFPPPYIAAKASI
jgi:hypothetical protein